MKRLNGSELPRLRGTPDVAVALVFSCPWQKTFGSESLALFRAEELPPVERQDTKSRIRLEVKSSISQCMKHPRYSSTDASLQQVVMRERLLVFVPHTYDSELGRRGLPEKLSQSIESVGDGPKPRILVLVFEFEVSAFCCADVKEDMLVAIVWNDAQFGAGHPIGSHSTRRPSMRPTIKVVCLLQNQWVTRSKHSQDS